MDELSSIISNMAEGFSLGNFAAGGASYVIAKRLASLWLRILVGVAAVASIVSFVIKHPRFSGTLAGVLTITVISFSLIGCSSPTLRVNSDGIVINDDKLLLGAYCVDELNGMTSPTQEFMSCANKLSVLGVPNINSLTCAKLRDNLRVKMKNYNNCVSEYKATNVIVNPFNRIRQDL